MRKIIQLKSLMAAKPDGKNYYKWDTNEGVMSSWGDKVDNTELVKHVEKWVDVQVHEKHGKDRTYKNIIIFHGPAEAPEGVSTESPQETVVSDPTGSTYKTRDRALYYALKYAEVRDGATDLQAASAKIESYLLTGVWPKPTESVFESDEVK